jgi:hypothetical protein
MNNSMQRQNLPCVTLVFSSHFLLKSFFTNGDSTMVNVANVIEGYKSDEFASAKTTPHAQWVNKSKANYGLLIDRSNIEASGFNHTLAIKAGGWRRTQQEFSGSPGLVDCLVCPEPILIVLRRGASKVYDKDSGAYLGIYKRQEHARLNVNRVTKFLIFLAVRSENGYSLLHQEPMQLSMKGVQRAAFIEPEGPLDVLDKAVEQFYSGAPKFAFALHLSTYADTRGQGSNSSLVTCLRKPELIGAQADLDTFFVGEANLKLLHAAYASSQAWQVADGGTPVASNSPEVDSKADYL